MDEHQFSNQQVGEPAANAVESFPAEIEALTAELLGYVADKWTMIVLEELAEHGTLRFNELRREIPTVSQKMLTQTLRQMESVGLVGRKIHPVIPPKVEYELTSLGFSLGQTVCNLWHWVADNAETMNTARLDFARRAKNELPKS